MTTTPPPTAIHVMEASWGNGEAHVYQCVPPMRVHDYVEADHDREDCTGESPCTVTHYVWVSAADVVYSGPETYIFACDREGRVTDWGELPGSIRGVLDHGEALRGAGYAVSHASTTEQENRA